MQFSFCQVRRAHVCIIRFSDRAILIWRLAMHQGTSDGRNTGWGSIASGERNGSLDGSSMNTALLVIREQRSWVGCIEKRHWLVGVMQYSVDWMHRVEYDLELNSFTGSRIYYSYWETLFNRAFKLFTGEEIGHDRFSEGTLDNQLTMMGR